ncbi:glutathione S-transferase 1-like [Episyrphus balteatus]|uniref:glutathione S-transferase 1-like n=1 Tax=Episyrphus balteatus TaxID=286459 RepID=UPI0024855DE2|nr:glutathione S-transferase 1-like [Episyrphus balteatus]
MVLNLYGLEPSPACRTVLLTLNALGCEFKLKKIQLKKFEQKTEDFRKKNPLQLIPVLEDEGQYLADSHAISAYLVRKYAKNDSLYPKDFKQRALVDHRLFFDSGVLFASLNAITIKVFQENNPIIPEDKQNDVISGYEFLEKFLENSNYVAGENVTIADFSILATVSSLNYLVPIDGKKFPKVMQWMELMTKLPYYERGNELGLALFAKKCEIFLKKE